MPLPCHLNGAYMLLSDAKVSVTKPQLSLYA